MTELLMDQYPGYPMPGGWHLIPAHMRKSVYDYVMFGHPVGSFLTAVISDAPVSEVYACADDLNQLAMLGWMKFLYNYVPVKARRSEMNSWIAAGGMQQFKERTSD